MSQTAEQKAAAEKEAADKKAAAEKKAADKKAADEKKAAEKEAAEQEPKSEKVHVKFLRSHPSFGYFAGDTATINRADFDKYNQHGPFFEEIEAEDVAEDAAE